MIGGPFDGTPVEMTLDCKLYIFPATDVREAAMYVRNRWRGRKGHVWIHGPTGRRLRSPEFARLLKG